MLEKAFQFRKAELWNTLADDQMFAVKLPSGQIGYCIVMGNGGEYFALGIYLGDSGLATYMSQRNDAPTDVDKMNTTLAYNVINCNFSQADEMNFGLKEPIRDFSKRSGMPIPRKVGWPEFVRHRPFMEILPVDNETDAADVVEALSAALHVAELLKTHNPDELGLGDANFLPTDEYLAEIPLLLRDDNGEWQMETIDLPEEVDSVYPQPKFEDPELRKRVALCRKKGIVECGTVVMPAFLENNPDHTALFAVLRLSDGLVDMTQVQKRYDLDPDYFLRDAVEGMLNKGLPQTLVCTDELTHALFADFCRKTGVRLVLKRKSREFLNVVQYLYSSLRMGM